MLRRIVVLSILAIWLSGCGDFYQRVWGPGGTRDQWQAYRNSSAYYQEVRRARVYWRGETITCYKTVDRLEGWSDTRCY